MEYIKLKKLMEELNQQLSADNSQSNSESQTDNSQTTDPADAKKQKELGDLTKKQTALNDKIRKLDGEKQKLEDPIRRKVQDLDRKKASLVKGLGNTTKKIQDLENK